MAGGRSDIDSWQSENIIPRLMSRLRSVFRWGKEEGGGVDRLEEVNASFRHGFDENRDKKNEAGWIVVSINYLQLAF